LASHCLEVPGSLRWANMLPRRLLLGPAAANYQGSLGAGARDRDLGPPVGAFGVRRTGDGRTASTCGGLPSGRASRWSSPSLGEWWSFPLGKPVPKARKSSSRSRGLSRAYEVALFAGVAPACAAESQDAVRRSGGVSLGLLRDAVSVGSARPSARLAMASGCPGCPATRSGIARPSPSTFSRSWAP
jgi:hypothetical protein